MNTNPVTRLIGGVIASAILASAALLVQPTPAAAVSATPALAAAADAAPGAPVSDVVAGMQPTTPTTVFDGAVAINKTVTFDVMGAIGVPAYDVDAVVLQVRARTTTKASAATVWSAGARPANASMLVPAASDRAQTMLVALAPSGQVRLRNTIGASTVTVEVVGYVADSTGYRFLSPARALDTTSQESVVPLLGANGVPATGVGAVVVQFQVISATAAATATVSSTDSAAPAVTLTAAAGTTGTSAFAIVPVGPAGSLTVNSSVPGTRVALDVVGWFDAALPDQSDDTFRSSAPSTITSSDPAASSTVTVDLADSVPAGSGAVALSIRPVGAATELKVAPGGGSFDGRPAAPIANGDSFVTVARLGADDTVDVQTSAALAQLDVTVLGTFDRAIAAPADSSWQFDPWQWVTFTASGQGRTVRLVNIGSDGNPTGAYLTPGTQWVVAGDPASVTVRVTGRGTATLRSTSTIGSVNLIATPVDGLQGMPVVAKNVLLQPGVRTVPDTKIVFPDRTLPDGGSPAPFTLAEIEARVMMPAEDDPDPFNAGARVAVVMSGRAPATGTVLAGVGNAAVTGKVVAPEGLPNLNRGGMSLVTIEYTSPTDVYTELRYEVDVAAGRLIDGTGAVSGQVASVNTGFAPRPKPTATAPSALRSPVNALADAVLPECETDVELAKAELKLFAYEGPLPKFTSKVEYVINGASLERFDANIGVQWNGKAETSLTVASEPKIKTECTLKDLPSAEIPAAPELLTFPVTSKVVLAAEIAVPVGLKVELKWGCEWNLDQQFTVRWNSATPDEMTSTKTADVHDYTCRPQSSATSTLIPRKIEAKVGIYVQGEMGARLGGEIAEALGKLFKRPFLGDYRFLKFKYGKELKFDWETDRLVLESKQAGSKAGQQVVAEGEFHLPSVKSMIQRFRVNLGVAVSVKLFEITIQSEGLYRAPSSPTLQVAVNGDIRTGSTIEVVRGDRIEIVSTMQYPNIGTMVQPDAPIVETADWIDTAPGEWERLNMFTASSGSPAPQVILEADIAPSDCLRFSEPHTVSFLPKTYMLSLAPTSGWAGSVTLHCVPPTLTFEPGAVNFRAFETGDSVRTVQLRSEHAKGLTWSIFSDVPAWLVVSPRSGAFDASPDTADLQLSVDCDQMSDTTASTMLNASVTDVLGRSALAELDVSAECDNPYIRVDPSVRRGPGSVNVVTAGVEPDKWTLTDVPDWVIATPMERLVTPSLTSGPVSFTFEPRDPWCLGLPERTAEVTFTTQHRGTTTLKLVDPAVPPFECDSISTWGDPHIVTADGLAFDAQVVGEYVYAESDDATFALQARHEATTTPGVGRPTSVTGIAMRTGGAVVEVHGYRAPGLGRIRIDGVDTAIGVGETLSVNDQVQMTRQGSDADSETDMITITGPDGVTIIERFGAYLNTTHTFNVTRTDVRGLLGKPGGGVADDLVPKGASVGYTVDQVYGHTPELYALTDSWRLTDPAESMFTVAYDGFDDVNWPMDDAALAPYRAQVVATLGSITKVCGGSMSGTQDYTIDALALELSIGTPLGDLGRFTCNYLVYAYNGAGPEQYPTPGVAVTFDAPGLTACTGVSNNDGWASCRLAVALDELDAAPDSVTIAATAAWPNTGEVLATTTIPVAVKAPLSGSPAQAVTSLDLPITLAGLSISGTLVDDPDDNEPWMIRITGYDVSGTPVVQTVKRVAPDASGQYDLEVTLPPNAVDADIEVARPRRAEVVHVTGLAPDTFVPATFDVDARDGRLTIDGRLLYGGAPPPDSPTAPSVVRIMERGPDGTSLDLQFVVPVIDPVTGEYHVEFALSPLTRSVVVSVGVATNGPGARIETAPLIVSGFGPAISQSITYDAIVDQPRLTVGGTALVNGAPAHDFFVVARQFADDGTQLAGTSTVVDVDPVTGAYTVEPFVDPDAVRIRFEFQVAGLSTDNPVFEVTGLTPGVSRSETFDFDVENIILRLGGSVRFGDQLPVGEYAFVMLQPYDSNGDEIVRVGPFGPLSFTRTEPIFSDGTYQATFLLPSGTAEVRGDVFVGGSVRSSFVSPVSPGDNELTVDIQTVALTLHGTHPFPDDGSISLRVTAPSAGEATYQTRASLTFDEDGTYRTTVQLPVGTQSVKIETLRTVSMPSGDIETVVGRTTLQDIQPGSNDIEYDFPPLDTFAVHIDGSITSDGVVTTDHPQWRLRLRNYHEAADQTLTLLSEQEVTVDVVDGLFTLDHIVPAGTNLIDIAHSPVEYDDWGNLGAQRVEPDASITVQLELVAYVQAWFTYTNAGADCLPKLRAADVYLADPADGFIFNEYAGFPSPAIPIGTILVVPEGNLTETVRLTAHPFWNVGFFTHPGSWDWVVNPGQGIWISMFAEVAGVRPSIWLRQTDLAGGCPST